MYGILDMSARRKCHFILHEISVKRMRSLRVDKALMTLLGQTSSFVSYAEHSSSYVGLLKFCILPVTFRPLSNH